MNKKELIRSISNETKLSQTVTSQVLNSFLNHIEKIIKKDDTLSLIGYFTIGTRQRAARTAFNPKTKQKINIPAKKVAYIKLGNKLKK